MRRKKGNCDLVLEEQGRDLQEGIRKFLKEQKVREGELLTSYQETLKQMEELVEKMRRRQEERRRLEEEYTKPAPEDLLVLPIPLEPEEVSSSALNPKSQRTVHM